MSTKTTSDVTVVVLHPWGDIEEPLEYWMQTGPGLRPGVRPVAARRTSTGEPLPLSVIPRGYRNTAWERLQIRLGLLADPWRRAERAAAQESSDEILGRVRRQLKELPEQTRAEAELAALIASGEARCAPSVRLRRDELARNLELSLTIEEDWQAGITESQRQSRREVLRSLSGASEEVLVHGVIAARAEFTVIESLPEQELIGVLDDRRGRS